MVMIEKHGAYWQDEPGWRVIHQRYDAPTGLLAVIMKHDGRELIKADLFMRFDADERPLPRCEPVGCVEAVFGPNDVHEAAMCLETAIRNRTNDGQPPATRN
jgi:hypothetical protein